MPPHSLSTDNDVSVVRFTGRPHASPERLVASVSVPLSRVLYGDVAGPDWPVPDDAVLLAALVRLADAHRVKELLPLHDEPFELALVRCGADVRVSLYPLEEGGTPWLLDRRVALHELLDACVECIEARVHRADSALEREVLRRLARRGEGRSLRPQNGPWPCPVRVRGEGPLVAAHPVRFRFEGTMRRVPQQEARGLWCSDAHALLFEGRLESELRGRWLDLGVAPLVPRLEAMLGVVEAAMDAETRGRRMHLRRSACGTKVHLHRDREGNVRFGLGVGDAEPVFVRVRDVADVALAVCALGRELVRQVLRGDRAQRRNLRLRALRRRLRTLRRAVDERRRLTAIRNEDADRLRWHDQAPAERAEASVGLDRVLRYQERWRLRLDGVLADDVHVCDDVLVVSSLEHQVGIDRASGEVRWARERPHWARAAGPWLVRQGAGGVVECCSVRSGEPVSTTVLDAEVDSLWWSRLSGLPLVCILVDARGGLYALDPRTGELRWRRVRLADASLVSLHGRALLVAREGGALEALDVCDGETVWRGQLDGEPSGRPLVLEETVVVPVRRGEDGGLAAFDLWRGVPRWSRTLGELRPRCLAPGDGFLVSEWCGAEGEALAVVEPRRGLLRWMGPAAFLEDAEWHVAAERVIWLSSHGEVGALSPASGAVAWRRRLGEPGEAVPRRLHPMARGGALFVPFGGVSALRPDDGTSYGAFDVDVVPDWFYVGAQGELFVAEESGWLVHARPAPALALVPRPG